MIRQTVAFLIDGYRELNAKKLFWITLMLSGLVVAAFAVVGITEKGLKVLVWEFEFFGLNSNFLPPDVFYNELFTNLGLGFWLAWLASILALISTAGIIPEFISGGAIELTLSKPMGRLRMYLTKFCSGLLFMALQVTVFTAGAFLVIGFKGGSWEPRLFLAIPIVVILFSYLYSVCALLGLLTRSTVAALLLTLLFWLFLFSLNAVDSTFLQLKIQSELRHEAKVAEFTQLEDGARRRLAEPDDPDLEPVTDPTREQLEQITPRLASVGEDVEKADSARATWRTWSHRLFLLKTAFPKTGETTELLRRALISEDDLERRKRMQEAQQMPALGGGTIDQREFTARIEAEIRERSELWVLGTSLGFEALVLALGAFIFCRRDF